MRGKAVVASVRLAHDELDCFDFGSGQRAILQCFIDAQQRF
jgi:hypothetical protein